jgi:hypothetical protein
MVQPHIERKQLETPLFLKEALIKNKKASGYFSARARHRRTVTYSQPAFSATDKRCLTTGRVSVQQIDA